MLHQGSCSVPTYEIAEYHQYADEVTRRIAQVMAIPAHLLVGPVVCTQPDGLFPYQVQLINSLHYYYQRVGSLQNRYWRRLRRRAPRHLRRLLARDAAVDRTRKSKGWRRHTRRVKAHGSSTRTS